MGPPMYCKPDSISTALDVLRSPGEDVGLWAHYSMALWNAMIDYGE